jgi:hypothetical protein
MQFWFYDILVILVCKKLILRYFDHYAIFSICMISWLNSLTVGFSQRKKKQPKVGL